jgi:prepilin-type N-terminal cleavage/methylation domain-containing protein
MKKNNFKNGFTLLEVLVAITIFISIAGMVSVIFINVLKSQQKSFHFQEVQDNASYIMETIAREIRMSGVVDNRLEPYDDTSLTILRNGTEGNNIKYFLDPNEPKIMRQAGTETALQLNSNKVKVINFHFYVSSLSSTFETSNYRRVTLVLGLVSVSDPMVNINLQTTITSRPPPCASGICQPL